MLIYALVSVIILSILLGVLGKHFFRKGEKSYVFPASFYKTYLDLTRVQGRYTEAYGFLLCGSPETDEKTEKAYFNNLLILLHGLIRLGETEKRDIVVGTCEFTPDWQLNVVYKLGVIVVRMELIMPNREALVLHWKYNFTKYNFWKLLFWNRILVMDIDFLCADSFIAIWDDPATQVITKPPEEIDLEALYFGQPIKSLYPYVEAHTYDTWQLELAKKLQYFNNGILMMKPSIAHWNVLMNITFDLSIRLPVMEQDASNIVYNKSGPVPWTTFSEKYNWHLRDEDDVQCAHGKFWKREESIYFNKIWIKLNDDTSADIYDIAIISKELKCVTDNSSLSIDGLRMTKDEGLLFYKITEDFEHFPSYKEIKDSYVGSGKANNSISESKVAGFKIKNLVPDTEYRIFYYVETFSKFTHVTDIFYRDCTTSLN